VFFTSVSRSYGMVCGGCGVLLTALSPILLRFAPSLYWASFLAFAPFVAAWVAEPYIVRRRWGAAARLAMIFGLVLVKALCGYEYITAVILSPLAAIACQRVRAGA